MPKSLCALAAAALAACASPTDANRWIRVATSDTTFDRVAAPAVAYVPFSVTNGSAATVYLPACNDSVLPEVELQTGPTWTSNGGFMCLAIYSMAPVRLVPGGSAQGRVPFAEPGRYRLRVALSRSYSAPPSTTAVSPAFTVR